MKHELWKVLMKMHGRTIGTAVWLVLVVAAGCGGSGDLVSASGTVTLDGEPLNNGVLYGQSSVCMASITDGTSNTIAIGERMVLPIHRNEPARWRSWCGPGGLGIGSTVSSSVSYPLNHPSAIHGFSSHHPGGALLCFADGSARFLSDTIESRTGGVDPSNAGNHADFVQAAFHGQMGVYQLIGARNSGSPIPHF